jgi:hypothetical protein
MKIKTEYQIWKDWFGKDKSQDRKWVEVDSLVKALHKQFHGMDHLTMVLDFIKKESNK